MEAVNYSTVRQHLAKTMDKVNADRAPLLVTRQNGEPVIMMSLADFNALEETAYLLRSPSNARRLLKSIDSIEQGRIQAHELIEPGA